MSISFLVGNWRIRFSGKTDVGRVRALNEDSLHVPTDMPLVVVADGMGGHAAGEVASRTAVDTILEYFQATGDEPVPTWPLRLPQLQVDRDRMATAIKLANVRIYEMGKNEEGKKGMGTTVEALYFAQGRYYIGHVGDSRVYLLRGDRLTLLTEDHSLLNDYRRMREMTPEEIRDFPHKNVVVRALGLAENVYVDVYVDQFEEGDVFLLCSDGLSDMLDDAEIRDVLVEEDNLDKAAAKLVDAANEAGGKDNITAALARVEPA
ncbi:MAG: Stp1/IreP family PP2C-type Ser/Thr phosphatase [Deltaproteobacteria bacterium]|nr:MAG: Stp1/IreP family PP2C-type Ser/Thr phosphatase [Deltaproteobacteria bacterium]